MRWGRHKPWEKPHTHRTAAPQAILIAGAFLCAVFFLTSVRGDHTMPIYPEDMAEEAVLAFVEEHAALADVLGIDEFFPHDAIPAGTFEEKSEAGYRDFVDRGWSFGDYLRDACRALIGGMDS